MARNARKFVFDEDACRRIAHVVATIPDLLVREMQFARAPFDLTWIEWPSWHYWMALRDQNPGKFDSQGQWGNTETADYANGFLIDHNRINVITAGTKRNPDLAPQLTAMQYRLNTEWPVDEQLEFARRAGASRLVVDNILWGSTYDLLTPDERRTLRAHNVVEYVPFNPKWPETWTHHMADAGMQLAVRGSVGELRTIIALLLILNRPSLAMYRHVPSTRRFYRGRVIPYMSHTTVNIPIDPVPTLRLIGTPAGESVLRRWHEVKGHYCHDKTARDFARIAGCLHEFKPTYEDWTPVGDNYPRDQVNHWVCAVCEGKRWWRSAHGRGTAEVGFVNHDAYLISDRSSD